LIVFFLVLIAAVAWIGYLTAQQMPKSKK